jgi:hypothetical protein
MQQQQNHRPISQGSIPAHSLDQSQFLLVAQLAGRNRLFSNKFDRDRGVRTYQLLRTCPVEVALEAEERTIDGGRFLLALLQHVPISKQLRCRDLTWRKKYASISSSLSGQLLIPGDKVRQVAHVIPNRSRGKSFLFSHPRFIDSQGTSASRRNRRCRGSLHIPFSLVLTGP